MIVFTLTNNSYFQAEFYKNEDGYIMDSAKQIPLYIKKVSAVKFLNDSILHGINQGYSEFTLSIKDEGTFSNVCAPIAALLQYYKNNKNLKFNVVSESGYIRHTHLENPLIVSEKINSCEINSPFDKVWFFDSDVGINALVNSYLLYIRQADAIADGIIGSIDWCINEVMDNVLQHSEVGCGYIMGQIHPNAKRLSFCVFDCGVGIFNSLKKSIVHHPSTPLDAITMALQEKVTRDVAIGQGNGLWGLSSLVMQSDGILRISSGGATYVNNSGEERVVKYGDFNFGNKIGTTTVDFQLDYSKSIDISKALTGYNYQYTDLWLENLESDDDDNMVNIVVADLASGTGTRKSAEKLRNMILNIINNDKKRVTLDFAGINTISSSFADELVGKIIKTIGFVFFTQIFKLKNVNPLVIGIIDRSVGQRMAQMYYDRDMKMEE